MPGRFCSYFKQQTINLSESDPTQFLCYLNELIWVFQFLSKLGSADMAGEIGVIFNIPQPFTVRTRRLSQVIRLSHHDFKQMLQPYSEDGKTIISNFIQVLKIGICSILSYNQNQCFIKKLNRSGITKEVIGKITSPWKVHMET